MAKPFKIFLWIVGGLFALILLVAVVLPLLLDPNDYKDEAATATKDATGRELRINGDIDLKVFPWLGLSVADVTLANAEGFGPEPFMRIAQVNVGVKLMPLLTGKPIEVSKVRIDGLALNLAKDATGRNNWDFGKDEETGTPEPAEPQPPPQPSGPVREVSVGGIEITNVTFSYADQQTGAAYKLANLSLETGAIRRGDPIDVAIAFVACGECRSLLPSCR